MLEVVLLALLLATATAGWALMRRGRAHARWKMILEEAAVRLEGRASPGNMLDAPEFRGRIEGASVTLKLAGVHIPEKGTAIAEVKLSESPRAQALRIFIGWEVDTAPEGIAHFPEVGLGRAHLLEGGVLGRANDPKVADRFLERAATDLLDLRREAFAKSMSITVRGGHLALAVSGMTETSSMVERLAIVAARITKHLESALVADSALGPPGSRDPVGGERA